MLGELIGLALVGLASHLGQKPLSRDPDDEELYEAFMERLQHLDEESTWVQRWHDSHEDPQDAAPVNPCALRQRQSLLRAKDALDDLRVVTRHAKFNPKSLLDGCMASFPEESPSDLIRDTCWAAIDESRNELNNIMGNMADYERVLKSSCPSVWTEKQGLEDIRLVVKGNPRQAMVAAIKRGVPARMASKVKYKKKHNESYLDVPDEYFPQVVRWYTEKPDIARSADPMTFSYPPGTLTYHTEPERDLGRLKKKR